MLNVVWITVTFIGSLASIRAFYNALTDYLYVWNEEIITWKEHQARIFVAYSFLATQFGLAFTQLFLFSLGIIAITTPPPSRILNNIIIGVFIAVALILAVVSLMENILRTLVLKTGEEGNDR